MVGHADEFCREFGVSNDQLLTHPAWYINRVVRHVQHDPGWVAGRTSLVTSQVSPSYWTPSEGLSACRPDTPVRYNTDERHDVRSGPDAHRLRTQARSVTRPFDQPARLSDDLPRQDPPAQLTSAPHCCKRQSASHTPRPRVRGLRQSIHSTPNGWPKSASDAPCCTDRTCSQFPRSRCRLHTRAEHVACGLF